jgi:hypothetical protein
MATKKPRLLSLYHEVLRVAAIWTNDEGLCSSWRRDPATNKEELMPVTIKGQRLVTPTDVQLSNPNWENRIVFHPLYETAGRGESEVHTGYRTYLNVNLNRVWGLTAARMLQLAASKTEHEKLSPDQTEYLSLVKEADDKMFATFTESILPNLPGDKAFVNIYIKPSGLVGGEKFSKAAIVSFPLMEALEAAEKAKSGYNIKLPLAEKPVNIRTKDRDTLIALLKYMMPNLGTAHYYDVGSLSQLAPTMDAMMNATARLVEPLNVLTKLFKDQLIRPDGLTEEGWERLVFPTDWAEDFKDLGPLAGEIKSIPPMMGNEPAVVRDSQAVAPAAVQAPAHPHQAQQPAAPGGRVPFPPTQPGYQPQQQPYQPQYQQQPQGPVRTPSGKLDFESVARNAPGNRSGYAGSQGGRDREPSWARGQSGYGGGGHGGYGGGGYGGGRKAF